MGLFIFSSEGRAVVKDKDLDSIICRIYNLSNNSMSLQDVVRELLKKDISIIGEVHGNFYHHLVQSKILTALSQAVNRKYRRGIYIAFEQLNFVNYVDNYRRDQRFGKPSLYEMLRYYGFDNNSWRLDLYYPLFKAAYDAFLMEGAEWIGLNVPVRVLQKAGCDGSENISECFIGYKRRSRQSDMILREKIKNSHKGREDASVSKMNMIQEVRDLFIANQVGGLYAPVIVFVGNVHAHNKIGVPVYLSGDKSVISVGMKEVDNCGEVDRNAVSHNSDVGYDIIIATERFD